MWAVSTNKDTPGIQPGVSSTHYGKGLISVGTSIGTGSGVAMIVTRLISMSKSKWKRISTDRVVESSSFFSGAWVSPTTSICKAKAMAVRFSSLVGRRCRGIGSLLCHRGVISWRVFPSNKPFVLFLISSKNGVLFDNRRFAVAISLWGSRCVSSQYSPLFATTFRGSFLDMAQHHACVFRACWGHKTRSSFNPIIFNVVFFPPDTKQFKKLFFKKGARSCV